jgi:hypothetical protein
MKWIKNKIKKIIKYFKPSKLYELTIQVHGFDPRTIAEVKLNNVLDINIINESLNSSDLMTKEFTMLMIHDGFKYNITKEIWTLQDLMKYKHVTYTLVEL